MSGSLALKTDNEVPTDSHGPGQVSIQGINNNMSSYIKIKARDDRRIHGWLIHGVHGYTPQVRSKLGDPDNTDEACFGWRMKAKP